MKTTFVDLKNTNLYRDGTPHEVFARLRREAPVAWNPEDDGRGFWAVTRYEDIVAVYSAYWAGLPAAEIRLKLRNGGPDYHDEIQIATQGLPYLFTRFRAAETLCDLVLEARP